MHHTRFSPFLRIWAGSMMCFNQQTTEEVMPCQFWASAFRPVSFNVCACSSSAARGKILWKSHVEREGLRLHGKQGGLAISASQLSPAPADRPTEPATQVPASEMVEELPSWAQPILKNYKWWRGTRTWRNMIRLGGLWVKSSSWNSRVLTSGW